MKKPGSRYRSISSTLLNVTEKLIMAIHLTSSIITSEFLYVQRGNPETLENHGMHNI